MKFYGHGIVWDVKEDKPLCQFEDGVYETTDKREIEALKKAGFEGEKASNSNTPGPAKDES